MTDPSKGRFAYVKNLSGWAVIKKDYEKGGDKPVKYTILCDGEVRAVRGTLRSAKRFIRKHKGTAAPKPYWEHPIVHREPDDGDHAHHDPTAEGQVETT